MLGKRLLYAADLALHFSVHVMCTNGAYLKLNTTFAEPALDVGEGYLHGLASFHQLTSSIRQELVGISNCAGEAGERQNKGAGRVIFHDLYEHRTSDATAKDHKPNLSARPLVHIRVRTEGTTNVNLARVERWGDLQMVVGWPIATSIAFFFK